MMKHFAKTVNGYKLFTIFATCLFTDIWQIPKYISGKYEIKYSWKICERFFKKLLISKYTTQFWTKVRIEKSENDTHKLLHGTSSYKKHCTFIFLVANLPTDYIVFASDTYCVRTTDQFIWKNFMIASFMIALTVVMKLREKDVFKWKSISSFMKENFLFRYYSLEEPSDALIKCHIIAAECQKTRNCQFSNTCWMCLYQN